MIAMVDATTVDGMKDHNHITAKSMMGPGHAFATQTAAYCQGLFVAKQIKRI